MRKFFTVLTIGVVALIAYTYGAKAGRGRYREIRAGRSTSRRRPRVKKARKRAMKRAEKAAKSL